MSQDGLVTLRRRKIYELSDVTERLYGLPENALATVVSLDVSENMLLSLQRRLEFPRRPGASVAGNAVAAAAGRGGGGGREHRADSDADSEEEEGEEEEEEGCVDVAERSALHGMRRLAHLCLRHNQLRSLRGLSGAAATLTVLVAPHNALSTLEGLEGCGRLRYVDLRHNEIRSLAGLPRSTTAAAVSRRGSSSSSSSSASSSDGAAAVPFVEPPAPPYVADGVVLLLSFNRLRGAALAALRHGCAAAAEGARRWGEGGRRPWVPTLTHLDLSSNYIEDLGDVARHVRIDGLHLRRLRHLDLGGNPCLVNGSLASAARGLGDAPDDSAGGRETCRVVPAAVEGRGGAAYERLLRRLASHLYAELGGAALAEGEGGGRRLTIGVRGAEGTLLEAAAGAASPFARPPPSWRGGGRSPGTPPSGGRTPTLRARAPTAVPERDDDADEDAGEVSREARANSVGRALAEEFSRHADPSPHDKPQPRRRGGGRHEGSSRHYYGNANSGGAGYVVLRGRGRTGAAALTALEMTASLAAPPSTIHSERGVLGSSAGSLPGAEGGAEPGVKGSSADSDAHVGNSAADPGENDTDDMYSRDSASAVAVTHSERSRAHASSRIKEQQQAQLARAQAAEIAALTEKLQAALEGERRWRETARKAKEEAARLRASLSTAQQEVAVLKGRLSAHESTLTTPRAAPKRRP